MIGDATAASLCRNRRPFVVLMSGRHRPPRRLLHGVAVGGGGPPHRHELSSWRAAVAATTESLSSSPYRTSPRQPRSNDATRSEGELRPWMIRGGFLTAAVDRPRPSWSLVVVTGGTNRSFASTSTSSSSHLDKEVDDHSRTSSSNDSSSNDSTRQLLLLYERTPDNYTLMRTGIGFSSFHTLYWLWYNTDFIPAVNASPVNELHIDPAMGLAGFAFAIAIQAVFILYPKRLVSKIELKEITKTEDDEGANKQKERRHSPRAPSHELLIYTHTLPFVMPSSSRPSIVKVGNVLLDPNSSELQSLLKECDGDLSTFRGTLGMGTKWPPFLLDVRYPSNVPRPRELLAALLYPEQLNRTLAAGGSVQQQGVGRGGRGELVASSTKISRRQQPQRVQQQPKRGRNRR